MPEKGVLYISGDDNKLKEAKKSAKSVKSNAKNIQTALVSDTPNKYSEFDIQIYKDLEYNFRDKVKYMSCSPFEKTVFLDTDTYVWGPINELFDILNKYTIAAAREPCPPTDTSELPRSFPELNTGVIAYKMPESQIVFDNWRKYFNKLPFEFDQPSFRMSFHSSNVNSLIIPPSYNCRSIYSGFLNDEVKIIHGRHRECLDKICKKINKQTGMRVHYPVGDDIHLKYKSSYNIYEHILAKYSNFRKHISKCHTTIRKEGLIKFIKSSYEYLLDR